MRSIRNVQGDGVGMKLGKWQRRTKGRSFRRITMTMQGKVTMTTVAWSASCEGSSLRILTTPRIR